MPPRAATSYKKQDGNLTISDDSKYLFWTPSHPPASAPTVTIPAANIENLQQSKADNPKVALRVVLKDSNYTFNFTSKDGARQEQQAITDALRNALHNATPAAVPLASTTPATAATAPNGDAGAGQSGAMAFAKSVMSKTTDESWYDDNTLKSDISLQRSLLESNKPLNDRFYQALKDKPDTVSLPQFSVQFWSTRLHLLRAHAIDKQQQMGEYNVLPEIRYEIVHRDDGAPSQKTLNVTKEQIKLIFKQYPVVKHAFNAEVPPMNQNEFWTRFFQSRLLKKLKGARIDRDDPQDSALDKYIEWREPREVPGTNDPMDPKRMPHFIDLSGNEQNHSQRKGNRPDYDMRESNFDQPILHVLNNLSEKMMKHVKQDDEREAHAPIGMDEETFQQLQLRDLAMNDADNRVVLNLRERDTETRQGEDDLSADAKLYAQQDPNRVISSLQSDLQPSHLGSDAQGRLHLDDAIGYHSDSDSDSDDEGQKQSNGTPASKKDTSKASRINSHAAVSSATSSILSSITQRRTNANTDPHSLSGLSQTTFDTLTVTHSTTTEFLHYFWSLFLSGDGTRTQELAQLVTTLDRSLDRINAVAEGAEKERQEKIERLRKQIKDYYEKTGKKRKVDESTVGGGKRVVNDMLRPTVEALRKASEEYRRVFEEQSREVTGQGVVQTAA